LNKDIFFQKKKLRQEVFLKVKKYKDHQLRQLSNNIISALEKNEYFQKANLIFAYWSLPGEVNTHDFINKWHQNKKILLPVINKNILEIKSFHGQDKMVKSKYYNVMEPTGEQFNNIGDIDLIIVPGVAFDRLNNRLGRGRGYYDNLLTSMSAYKIGICFYFQFFDKIPTNSTDMKMDKVITDYSIL